MLERIFARCMTLGLLAGRMEMLDRFALYDHRIGALGENGFDRELMTHAHVAHRPRERAFVRQRLIPESTERGETGADEDLVDGRVVPHPRVAARKGASIFGKQNR